MGSSRPLKPRCLPASVRRLSCRAVHRRETCSSSPTRDQERIPGHRCPPGTSAPDGLVWLGLASCGSRSGFRRRDRPIQPRVRPGGKPRPDDGPATLLRQRVRWHRCGCRAVLLAAVAANARAAAGVRRRDDALAATLLHGNGIVRRTHCLRFPEGAILRSADGRCPQQSSAMVNQTPSRVAPECRPVAAGRRTGPSPHRGLDRHPPPKGAGVSPGSLTPHGPHRGRSLGARVPYVPAPGTAVGHEDPTS